MLLNVVFYEIVRLLPHRHTATPVKCRLSSAMDLDLITALKLTFVSSSLVFVTFYKYKINK